MFQSEHQNNSLGTLLQLTHRFANRPDSQAVWEPNVVGVFGPRGSGKSTVLKMFSDNLKKASVEYELANILVVEPLDCTQIPLDVSPGSAVLLHLQHNLKQYPVIAGKLRNLAERYSLASKSYSDLCLDLSGSSEEFGYHYTEGTKNRLNLMADLTQVLKELEKECRYKMVLVPLDDFDLVRNQAAQDWVNALLDNLHQSRILFLVTADFYRLQYILVQENGYDEKTSRALLNKLIPPAQRVTLEPWSFDTPQKFPQVSGSLLEQLKMLVDFTKVPQNIVYQLLPRRPRGLESLYEKLPPFLSPQLGSKNLLDLKQYQENLNDPRIFLELLAICREETLLARRLKETKSAAWSSLLELKEPDEQLAWGDHLDQAIGRAKVGLFELEPLAGFEPNDHEKRMSSSASQGQRTEMRHPPNWGYPLRQDHLRSYSLQDVLPEAVPFWTELLLSIAFKANDRSKAMRNRLRFIEQWQPIKGRFKQACFEITAEIDQFQSFFSAKSLVVRKAAMLWIEPQAKTVHIGWHCLLRSLAGVEDPLHHRWRNELYVSSEPLAGNLPELGQPEVLGMLPDEIWAMILLTEGLARCPWLTFSRSSLWRLHAHLALAAGLVRSAYVYALVQAGKLSKQHLSDQQAELYEILTLRDPMTLVSGGERALIQNMDILFTDKLEEKVVSEDSLSRAFKAYLDSAPYQAVLEMTQDVIKLGKLKDKRARRQQTP